jgi:hypothetical protein
MKSMVRLPRRGLVAAGIALVTVLTVARAYVEANPKHHYGGLHLTSHPPLAAYLLLAVPALALIWRDRRPVEVHGLAVAGVVGWAALGRIDRAAPAHLRTGTLTRCGPCRVGPRVGKRAEFGGDVGGLGCPDPLEGLQRPPQHACCLGGVAHGQRAAAQAGLCVSLVPGAGDGAGQVQSLLVALLSLREVTADRVQRPLSLSALASLPRSPRSR